MLKYEAVLLDPSPGEVAEKLSEAVSATNAGCRERRLDDSAARWRKFARQATGGPPEGWQVWSGSRTGSVPAAQLLGGWWTDALGRRHVVLRGRQLTGYEERVWLEREPLADRGALWVCHPNRLVQRADPGREPVWLAACGCGVVGTPDALAWTGSRCGPCHDYEEEFGPGTAVEHEPAVLTGCPTVPTVLTVRRDGLAVAAAGPGAAAVWLLGRPTEPRVIPLPGDAQVNGLAFLAGGRLGLLQPELVTYNLYAVGPARPEAFGPDGWVGELAADADGRAVVGTDDGLEIWEPPAAARTRLLRHPRRWPTPFTMSADGRFAVFGAEGRVVVFDLRTGSATGFRFSDQMDRAAGLHAYRRLAFDPNRLAVYAGGGGLLERYDATTGVVVVERWLAATVAGLAVSADGRRLVVREATGVLHILDPNTLATLAAFDWHLGPPTAFALSPDGSYAATAGIEGVVKLWPLDRLLPAPSA